MCVLTRIAVGRIGSAIHHGIATPQIEAWFDHPNDMANATKRS